MTPEQRLERLGISLPDVPAPVAAYVPVIMHAGLVYTSGQLPTLDGKLIATGIVGADVDVETAASCARQCALNAVAAVKSLVDLDRVAQVVKAVVFVASAPSFTAQPVVANGASDMLSDIFGPAGAHAPPPLASWHYRWARPSSWSSPWPCVSHPRSRSDSLASAHSTPSPSLGVLRVLPGRTGRAVRVVNSHCKWCSALDEMHACSDLAVDAAPIASADLRAPRAQQFSTVHRLYRAPKVALARSHLTAVWFEEARADRQIHAPRIASDPDVRWATCLKPKHWAGRDRRGLDQPCPARWPSSPQLYGARPTAAASAARRFTSS